MGVRVREIINCAGKLGPRIVIRNKIRRGVKVCGDFYDNKTDLVTSSKSPIFRVRTTPGFVYIH